MSSKLVEIVTKTQDALIEGDLDTYVSCLAEDVVFEDPSVPRTVGREDVKEFLKSMLSAFRELAFLDKKVFTVGRKVAMPFTLRFTTHDDKEGTIEGVDVFEFNERDEIQRVTSYYTPGGW